MRDIRRSCDNDVPPEDRKVKRKSDPNGIAKEKWIGTRKEGEGKPVFVQAIKKV